MSMNTTDTETSAIPFTRGGYGEILQSSLTPELQKQVQDLVQAAGSSSKVDEHGSWDFGIEWNARKGRGTALNWDLYGIGHDVHTNGLLIVIQIRQFHRHKAGYYPEIRKNYFLVGRNEDGTALAHPVSANVIHAAIRKGGDVVLRVQNWIFGFDYAQLIRQGDIALVPVSRRPAGERLSKRTALIEKSHDLKASLLIQNGHLYAKSPEMVHRPGTHPAVQGVKNKWYRVEVGNRADFWTFAAPSVD
jgi:hypothetical protein